MSWRSRKRSSEDDNTSGDHNTPGTGNPNETADSNSENPVSPVHDVVDRLLEVFAWHGIQQPEIPKFLTQFDGPRVSFGDLSSKERLLERLDDQILDFTQELFALDQNWLRRDDAPGVLRSHNFYKYVDSFPRFLLVDSVRNSGDGLWYDSHFSDYRRPSGTLYFFSHEKPSTETPADDTGRALHVGAVYKARIGTFEDRPVHRYIPVEAMRWNYWRARYQTVALMSIADHCNVSVLGRVTASEEETFAICSGAEFPIAIGDGSNIYSERWDPQYPYLGNVEKRNDPDYKEYWKWYYDQFAAHTFEADVDEARKERREIMLGDPDISV